MDAVRAFVDWHEMDHENTPGEEQAAYDVAIAMAKHVLTDPPQDTSVRRGDQKASDGGKLLTVLERIAIALESIGRKKQDGIATKLPPKYGSKEYRAITAWAKANGAPGTRAENALARAGITSFDEVTPERLSRLPNVGPLTIYALLDWAASKSVGNDK